MSYRSDRWLFIVTQLVRIIVRTGISHAKLRQKIRSEFDVSFVQFIFKRSISEQQENGTEHDNCAAC